MPAFFLGYFNHPSHLFRSVRLIYFPLRPQPHSPTSYSKNNTWVNTQEVENDVGFVSFRLLSCGMFSGGRRLACLGPSKVCNIATSRGTVNRSPFPVPPTLSDHPRDSPATYHSLGCLMYVWCPVRCVRVRRHLKFPDRGFILIISVSIPAFPISIPPLLGVCSSRWAFKPVRRRLLDPRCRK